MDSTETPPGSQALEAALLEIGLAHEEMKRIRSAYMSALKDENNRHSAWSERNTLSLYVRRIGNSLQTRWNRIVWRGPNGNTVYKSLPTSARGDVSDKRLAKYAQPWALPLVLAAEYRLRILRRRAAMANKAIFYIKECEKTHEEYANVTEPISAMRQALSEHEQEE